MAKVVAPSSLPSASHDITGKSMRRKTPSELRGEQLKRSNDLVLLEESPSTVFASNNALGNGLKKSTLLKNPRYIDTRMDEVFPVKKSRLRILSGKDNAKENNQMEQSSSFMNISLLSNLVTSQCKGNSVCSTDGANDKTVKYSQAVENSSQSIFRSVTELSSGGDKSTGLTSIDMGKALKGLAARETSAVSGLQSNSSKKSNDSSSNYSSDFCSEFCILGQKAPLDFTLKTSMRVVSSSSLHWIHKTIVSASMPQFSIQIGSREQIGNSSAGLPPASQASGSLVLHSWVHPQSTLPSSLISVLNSSSAAEAEFLSRRQLVWEDSFQSLYYMLRNNICRVFYVCTSQFVVMFTSGDASGGNKPLCNAYISQSTRGLRSILSEHVGKGLSKDEKARKLALQHWLEAIDPRHRYGHNLQFYYVKWLHCDSKQPFFYWLDIGEGKEVNLERCIRHKLQQQCIKYLGPIERKVFEVVVENGKFMYRYSEKLLDTRGGPSDAKWIFVLSTSKTLYVGLKKKGTFQHSSFLAGGATLAAGRLVVEDGILKAVWPHSGHYLPTEENFLEFMSFLMENDVDLTDVEKSPHEEEQELLTKDKRTNLKEDFKDDIGGVNTRDTIDENNPLGSNPADTQKPRISRLSKGVQPKISNIQIPERGNVFDIFKKETLPPGCRAYIPDSPTDDGYETAEESLSEEDFMVPKSNLFDEDEDSYDRPIPKEKILRRIVSHKEMNSYQLAKQLTSRWTTGAGPRIGCMRDYPQELQNQVLEQAHLSPRARVARASHSRTRSQIISMSSNSSPCKGRSATRSPFASNRLVLSQSATSGLFSQLCRTNS